MAYVKGKGTIVKHTIASTLTAIAQVMSVSLSGAASQTFDTTSLDTGVFKTKAETGYSEPGTCELELFFDPALSGHQFITDLIASPATNAMQITYANSGSTTQSFTACGVEVGVTVAMDDGVKMKVTYQITGDPGYPT
ncbi:MAG: hypothetical protein EBR82_23575 [Caulobacteraceae bacterium]|nr:hypothetical protein [Caulobacteraceae bacterium]